MFTIFVINSNSLTDSSKKESKIIFYENISQVISNIVSIFFTALKCSMTFLFNILLVVLNLSYYNLIKNMLCFSSPICTKHLLLSDKIRSGVPA